MFAEEEEQNALAEIPGLAPEVLDAQLERVSAHVSALMRDGPFEWAREVGTTNMEIGRVTVYSYVPIKTGLLEMFFACLRNINKDRVVGVSLHLESDGTVWLYLNESGDGEAPGSDEAIYRALASLIRDWADDDFRILAADATDLLALGKILQTAPSPRRQLAEVGRWLARVHAPDVDEWLASRKRKRAGDGEGPPAKVSDHAETSGDDEQIARILDSGVFNPDAVGTLLSMIKKWHQSECLTPENQISATIRIISDPKNAHMLRTLADALKPHLAE